MPIIGVYVRSFKGVAKAIDAYVEVKFAGKAYETSSLDKVTEGSWDEVFLMSVSDTTNADNVLKLKLIDDQKMKRDPTIGKVKPIPIPQILHEGALFDGRQPYDLVDSHGKVVGVLEVQIFTEKEKPEGPLSVLCCSWNVGNAPPPDNLSQWLKGVKEGDHQVVAIAAQECNYKLETGGKAGKESGTEVTGTDTVEEAAVTLPEEAPGTSADDRKANKISGYNKLLHKLKHKLKGTSYLWEKHLTKAMGDKYWLVMSRHMGQIRLLVFVRVDVVTALDLNSIHADDEATGIGHVVSNKGGVGIHINIYDTDLTFIGCHLAAHQDKVKARNEDYREIIGGLDLDPYDSDVLTFPHHVFWMGDLNYRLDYGGQAQTFAETPTPEDWHSLAAEIDEKAYAKLLKMDQLKKEIEAGRVLDGFREGEINFAPTFKVNRAVPPTVKADQYYLPKRSPAWCDRVLVRSNLPHKQAEPVDYFAAPEVTTSDHKPVGCVFSVPTVAKYAPGVPTVSRGLDAAAESTEQYELELFEVTTTGVWTEVAGDWEELQLDISGPPLEHKVTVVMNDAGFIKKAFRVLLKPNSLTHLLDERIFLKVEGTNVESMNVNQTLGRADLALKDIVDATTNGGHPLGVPVKATFSKKGVFTGVMEAVVKLLPATHTATDKKSKKGLLGRLAAKI